MKLNRPFVDVNHINPKSAHLYRWRGWNDVRTVIGKSLGDLHHERASSAMLHQYFYTLRIFFLQRNIVCKIIYATYVHMFTDTVGILDVFKQATCVVFILWEILVRYACLNILLTTNCKTIHITVWARMYRHVCYNSMDHMGAGTELKISIGGTCDI